MLRIRWTDAADDSAIPVGWQAPSMVLATLFLNLFFWWGPADQFQFCGPPLLFVTSLTIVILFVVGLFFVGPAFASHAAHRSLFELADASLGVLPAIAFRLVCAIWCVLWIAGTSGSMAFHILSFWLNRDLSVIEYGLFVGLLILFLFATGLQSLRTSAKLALYTNKIAVALLIAGAIRVRGYLPGAWSDINNPEIVDSVWSRVVAIFVTIGPMAFLAADYAYRVRTRKDVAYIGIFGLALPLAATLFVVRLVHEAAYHRRGDLGSLANIAVALWGGDSLRYLPQWMMVALITTFGLARFGVSMCSAAVSPFVKSRNSRLVALAVAVIAAVWLSRSTLLMISNDPEIASRLAASASAVLSADFLMKRWRAQAVRKVDWLGFGSSVVGCAAGGRFSYGVSGDNGPLAASILTSYVASFAFCVTARAIERLATYRRSRFHG